VTVRSCKRKTLAKYKKKRARELKHDRFRDTTMLLADRMAERVAGRGRVVLYILIGVVALAAAGYGFYRWRQKHNDEAAAAMGRAIAIVRAEVSTTPPPVPNPKEPVFSTEQERAQRAIEEFTKVAAKYGDPYRTEARYFIARSQLVTDREKGLAELQSLSSGSGEIAVLSKFVLAQAKESDGKLDEAAALYSELARMGATIVTPDSANLRLAMIYDKQGKKKEAADLLFNLVTASRNAKDAEGKPISESAASREAAQKLRTLDPTRHSQLPAPPVTDLF
jgi:tetratricopeptide (TPR) repeat protein